MKLISFALVSCVACSAASSDAPPAPASQTAQAVQAAARADASSVTGTWRFVLDASDVATPIRERCREQKEKAPEACLAEIHAQADKEKIRFTPDAGGRTVFRSFGVDGGREELFLEANVALEPNGPRHLRATREGGPAEGMDIEIVDGDTIALTDPKKGRLVYTRE